MQNRVVLLKAVVGAFLLFASTGITAQSPVSLKVTDQSELSDKKSSADTIPVKFIGLDKSSEDTSNNSVWLPESDALYLLRENRVNFSNNPANAQEIGKAVGVLKEWLESKGFLDAKISVTNQTEVENEKAIVFSIERGAITHVSDIHFTGNKNFTNEELLINLKESSNDWLDTYDKQRYEYYLSIGLLPFLQSKGFLAARFGEPELQRSDMGLFVTIPIHEGIRYRIGKIKITGAIIFSNEQIIKMLGMKAGEIADGKALRDCLYENGLKKAYDEKGFIQYDVDYDADLFEPTVDQTDGIANISINIDEGRAFKLLRIQFIGVDEQTSRFLRGFINIKDGQIFSNNEFVKGIEAINETNSFIPLDADKDVEILSDEEDALVEIKIKVGKN